MNGSPLEFAMLQRRIWRSRIIHIENSSKKILNDALERLLLPSLEREIRRELTEHAQENAVSIFARNLRSLLLQPPLRNKRVLAVDPGFKSGCKLAVLDEQGALLEDLVVFPHSGEMRRYEAKIKVEQLLRKYQLGVLAIGNGTACRETEQFVSELIGDLETRQGGTIAPAPPPLPPAPATPPVPPVSVTPPAIEIAPTPEIATTTDVPAVVSTESVAIPAPEMVPAEPTLPVPKEEVAPAIPQAVVQALSALESLPPVSTDIVYVIVNEAGASDYSASPIAKEEFPNHDAMTRGTVSIGRRLQDPLAELVKIDPQHVGVGLYQHDVKAKNLKESLETVIESCVNEVGVDLNTASVPLLRHVAGLNQLVARDLVEYRQKTGGFRSRDQIKEVPGVGEARFTQAAGFLKIPVADDPLDNTWIHPESYPVARQLLSELGFAPSDLRDKARLAELQEKLNGVNPAEIGARMNCGEPTIRDILNNLARPGRDPREDRPPPIFKKGILKLEDLLPGMELKGTVLNVVPFGAFVDIGLKDTGLVHISQMANRYIKNPYEIVAVGDVVTVWVIKVEGDRRRASLTMIAPGSEQNRRSADHRSLGPNVPREIFAPRANVVRSRIAPRERTGHQRRMAHLSIVLLRNAEVPRLTGAAQPHNVEVRPAREEVGLGLHIAAVLLPADSPKVGHLPRLLHRHRRSRPSRSRCRNFHPMRSRAHRRCIHSASWKHSSRPVKHPRNLPRKRRLLCRRQAIRRQSNKPSPWNLTPRLR